MRSWSCSQIENEEEEESWRERDQSAAQWDEEQKLEEILEQRRMEGSSLRAKIGGDLGTKKDGRKLLAVGGYAKSTRLVVKECMSQ